jgi:hypothetical protein
MKSQSSGFRYYTGLMGLCAVMIPINMFFGFVDISAKRTERQELRNAVVAEVRDPKLVSSLQKKIEDRDLQLIKDALGVGSFTSLLCFFSKKRDKSRAEQ